MNSNENAKLTHAYLEAMSKIAPATKESITNLTLEDLRPRSMTQEYVAQQLGYKSQTVVSKWESGATTANIKLLDAMALATLYKCRLEVVTAAIENTKKLIKEVEDNG